MVKFKSHLKRVAVLASFILLAGCATTSPKNPADPYQSFNRAMFNFNTGFNRIVFKPLTNIYDTVLPLYARVGAHNFYANIMTVPDIANDVLQANFRWAGQDALRLFLNTTLGLFGLVDVASKVGLPEHPQSFGLTLAKWGYTDSAYLVLPILGPTTVRGVIGMGPDYFSNPLTYVTPARQKYRLVGGRLIQAASDELPKEELLTGMALDPYVAVRNAYMQNREYLIKWVESGSNVSHDHHQDSDLSAHDPVSNTTNPSVVLMPSTHPPQPVAEQPVGS